MMKVLSLFNGMSFCSMALESLGVNVNKMYSSEIDKYANQATQAMFPDTIQLGDVTQWREWDIDWAGINLVTGGFPCQAWSMAGKQLGDKDERGMLFWTMLDIIKHAKHYNPDVQFLIENVKMKKEFEQYITTHTENALGNVHKILINSALVSAQNRSRYYWTSFEVEQPEDKGYNFIEIVDNNRLGFELSESLTGRYIKFHEDDGNRVIIGSTAIKGKIGQRDRVYGVNNKIPALTATDYKQPKQIILNGALSKLTPRECFRLQTVPEHHIDTLLSAGISNTQLYKMAGNGWTCDVISHILSHMK